MNLGTCWITLSGSSTDLGETHNVFLGHVHLSLVETLQFCLLVGYMKPFD